ncbi:hypothetical protein [Acaryochloris marina]|uniref:Uncharacterized protein n=1 Tax=Acaryochloris marina (strain MBIC 11017) TaxID=329726 RepID=B0C5M7_ACAM1|nr:hypothetical protein [Acaryochloris marina]ABW28748.1 hypothetical protein AM1_3758 [Acaryochloris marina MBIC11017]BDM77737.1 hypothetical protein AM10699_06100 [Acaryochloris marina MBIC10699]
MDTIQYKRSTKGCQARRRAEQRHSKRQPTATTRSSLLESSYKAQLDLAVKGVLFESLYPLSRDEIAERMTWLIADTKYGKINRVFASLQRLITSKLVAATRVVDQGKEVTKYLLNLPYEELQKERAARVRIQQLQCNE